MVDERSDELRDRVTRLEESNGFAERTVEQLSEEVRGLGRRVTELQAQVRRLEAQLSRLAAPPATEDESREE